MTQNSEGNLLEKRYGLDSGTLICILSKNGYGYQIDTAAADRSVDHDEFLEIWCSSHPDRAMRTVIALEYEPNYAYIISHHQRVSKGS